MPLPVIAGGAIAAFIATVLRYMTFYVIAKVLFSLGIVAFSIVGTDLVVDYLESQIQQFLNTLPGSVGQLMLLSGFGEAIKIIFNCWVIALNIKSLKGAFKGLKFS